MYNERIETLISAALADGKLTEKEKQILYKNAEAEGIDLDEFEMILDARLVELEKAKEEATKSVPKSNKLGDVRKCPACGALVNSFHRKCQECGYTFEDIKASVSVSQLMESLLTAKDYKDRIAIISSFPIPSAKGDLMEFISVLHPKVFENDNELVYTIDYFNEDSEVYKPHKDEEGKKVRPLRSKSADMMAYEANSYLCKYKECMEKIKLYFPNDEVLHRYVNEYDTVIKHLKMVKKRDNILDIIGCIFGGVFAILCLYGLYVLAKNNQDREPTFEERIEQKMEENAEKQLEVTGKIWDWLLDKLSSDE